MELLHKQLGVLDLLRREGDIDTVLSELCLTLETALPGARCSITLLDKEQTLNPAATPNLPDQYVDAVRGLTAGLAPGSSSAAAYRNQTVISPDIETDPLWEGLRDEAQACDIRACWSTPLTGTSWAADTGVSDEPGILGTLDCYFGKPRDPTADEWRVMSVGAAMASLAINTSRAAPAPGSENLYDQVTGLPNRRVFGQELKQALSQLTPQSDKLAILLLDLDHFKEVNDTFGYAVGDFLLASVAERLLQFRGTTDIVGRFGDDEFGILMGSADKTEDVKELATRVLEAVSVPFDFGGQHLAVSASLGGSIYPWDGEDAQTLLRNAENALYAAKKQGRNHFRLYAPTMGGYAFEKLQLKMALGYAVENRELELLYQPKVRSDTHEIIGAEALVYWNHPAMGRIGPSRFIPLAEETGLIVPIGEWVLKTACRQIYDWRQALKKDLSMAVNISGIQFREGGFVESVGAILSSARLEPRVVELEITETIAMHEVEKTLDRLHELNRLGVHISIDDFGTGYSSLAYLKRFPIHTLKIDKSFVLTTPEDTDNMAIVKAVIALAHSLGLSVVAEGVETAEQASFLRTEGCETLQGYHFSRPTSSADFSKLLASGFSSPTAA
ncbi:MAG: EAL domain-containing protein [Acidobacteriota bacterium]|nr:EAL domain-containing protein [Acidobacteriota bacterium]